MLTSLEITLTTLSFIFTAFLLLFAYLPHASTTPSGSPADGPHNQSCTIFRRIRFNIPYFTLVTYLLFWNVIHGVSSAAKTWKHNGEVWCDLATNVSVFLLIGVVASAVCIVRRLERYSSQRPCFTGARIQFIDDVFEICVTLLLPTAYMLLHFIPQNNRFDLVEAYGCFASVHDSLPAILIMWIPALLVSAVAFVFVVFCLRHFTHIDSHTGRISGLTDHLEGRNAPLTAVHFLLLVVASLVTAAATIAIGLSSVFVSNLDPWPSWGVVHEHVREIRFLQENIETVRPKIIWWCFAIISLVWTFVLFVIALGSGFEGTPAGLLRTGYQMSVKMFRRQVDSHKSTVKLNLPNMKEAVSRSSTSTVASRQTETTATENTLTSFWDDEDEINRSAISKGFNKTKPKVPPLAIPSTVPSEEDASQSPENDEEFIASTMSYLQSPQAVALGLRSPTESTFYSRPRRAPLPPGIVPPSPALESSKSLLHHVGSSPSEQPIPENASAISSIMDALWPQPPPPSTASIPRSSAQRRSVVAPRRSRAYSTASTSETNTGPSYPIYVVPSPTSSIYCSESEEQDVRSPRPFENASGSTVPNVPQIVLPPSRSSSRSLREKFSKERVRATPSPAPSDVIYMTVVKETV